MEPLKQEMKPLTKVVSEWVHEYLKKTDLIIAEDGDRATCEFPCSVKGDFSYGGYVEVYEERAAVEVYLYAPMSVPARKRAEVSELLVRINYGLMTGHIGLNFESGKVRFKGTVDVKEGTLAVAMVNDLVDRGMGILDHFLPAVMAVAHANMTPADAYAEVDDDAPKKEKVSLPDAESLKNVWPWEQFTGHAPLKVWAGDLRRAIENKGDAEAWALAGRAAVLINDDESYCRELLRRVAADAGMQFVYIPDGEVIDMPPASGFRGMAPLLIYLEPGRWMLEKDEVDESKEDAGMASKFQSRLSGWLREFNPSRPVVFAVSARKLDHVAKKLRQVGLFERYISLPPRSLELTGLDFIERLGRECCAPSLLDSLGKIGRLITWHFDQSEQRELAVMSLKRIQARENRAVEFLDLVHIATHDLMEEGLAQSQLESVRRQTAHHEAGHAVMTVLETDGQDIPDYTSIVPGASGFGGVTVESYGFYYSKNDDQTTYQDFRRDVRVALGGRAAEELLVGTELVSNGASGDLESASRQASRAFAKWGFAPSMEKTGQSESNLSVIIGNPTPSEYERLEKLTREFVAEEYRKVIERLTEHRALLNDVAERLLWDPIVDQDELAEICKKHGVKVLVGR